MPLPDHPGEPAAPDPASPGLPPLEEPPSPTGSPPRTLSMSSQVEVENCVANLSLAHEIVVNENFRFRSSSPPKDSLAGRVAEMMHQAFWDILREQLESSPPDYRQVVPLLLEVKAMLQALLLPGHARLRSQLDQVLDAALLRQEAEHGALDLRGLAAFVTATMAALCAPARDPEIRALRCLADPVDLFREVLRVLELMKKDMVNFTLSSLRPHLLQQAVHYERTKFQQLLDQQPGSLDHTTAWLQKAAEQEKRAATGLSGSGSDSGSSSDAGEPVASPSVVLNRGYLALLRWDRREHPYPETVLMDKGRLDALGQTVDLLALQAAVLLLTSAQCGGAVLSLPGFVGKLKQTTAALLEGSQDRESDLKGALQALGDQAVVQLNPALVSLGGPPLTQRGQDALRGQISDLWRPSNPVRTIIGERVQGFLRATLEASAARRPPPEPPAILGLLGPQLAELGAAFSKTVNFNRAVFGPRYAPVLRRLLFPFPPTGGPESGEVAR